MRDVKTIAKDLGLTTQTIYRRIKKLDEKHITIKDGKTYILETGLSLIGYEDIPETPQNGPKTPVDDTNLLTQQERYIKTLEEQLAIKDKQIDALTELTNGLSQRLQENSFLLAQKQQLELEPPRADQSHDINGDVTENVTDVKDPVTASKPPLLKRFKDFFKK